MGNASVLIVPFLQNDFKGKKTLSHVFEVEGNSLLGFVSPFLDFSDLRGMKLFFNLQGIHRGVWRFCAW